MIHRPMKLLTFFMLVNLFFACNRTNPAYQNLIKRDEPLIVRADSTQTFIMLEEAPLLRDGILEFDMTPFNSHGHIGAVIRHQPPDSWIYLGCDVPADLFGRANWFITTPNGTTTFAKDINKPYQGITRRIRIKYVQDIITLWIDGEEVICKELPHSATRDPGKVGFRAWDGGAMEVRNIKYSACDPLKTDHLPVEKIELSSPVLNVILDRSFPRVLEYTWRRDSARLFGQQEAFNYISINGKDYRPNVKVRSLQEQRVVYQLGIPELRISIRMQYEVTGNVLSMNILAIKEKGAAKVKTIGFPKNYLVSVKNSQTGGVLSTSEVEYDFSTKDMYRTNLNHKDHFYQLADKPLDSCCIPAGIAILNTDRLVAAIDNNVLQNLKQFRYQTSECRGEKYTGVWNGDWIYRGLDNEITALPWAKVVIATDMNMDRSVDWQDGAIALRNIMPELDGARKIRTSFFHLGMLSGSMTQYTFLRWLDYLKKIHLYTDGFGQIFQIKGYQSEGHDSAHPDYGNNFNRRAGGLKDLNTLFQGAGQYNADICLHINHSESYPEARSYSPEIVSDIPAWKWWDQSYFIIRETDILNGTFRDRLKELHERVPDLKTVYIDTYREERWIAYYTAKLFKEMGWAIWTEDSYALDRYASWVHYAPGGESRISRFVHHQNKDAYKFDPLLLGGYESRKYGVSDITAMMYSFMTHQLPYRYLMNFPLMKWTDEEAVFSDQVRSVVKHNQTVITKNNKVIVRGRDIFIPWDPENETKIYYYNTSGISHAWELPDSWSGLSQVACYELTDLGRKFIGSIPVQDGKLKMDLKPKTPYVVYKTEAQSMASVEWGEGSLVKDMGFDSKKFIHWKKGPESDRTTPVSIETSAQGNAFLSMDGGGVGEAVVSQKLTGLEGGKTYAASVWAELSGGRKAILGVTDYGGPEVSNYFELEGIKCTISSQKQGSYQRMRILFTMPGDKTDARLYLKADAGPLESFVHFDDARIVPYLGTENKEHLFYEDFEEVDEGIYPFIPGKASIRTHLSERHETYTEDVLSGNFSLKITSRNPNGLMAHTLPCNFRFQPNNTYTISFKYQVDLPERYRIVVKSHQGGDKSVVMNEYLNTAGVFRHTLTTGNKHDYCIYLYKQGTYGDSHLIIDDLTID